MASAGPIQQTILNNAPTFLRGPNVSKFLETIGFTLDVGLQSLAEGLKLSNPLLCDPVAFPGLSKDRKILLYVTEPDVSKRYRLAHWRQLRRHAGSHYGEMLNVQPMFFRTSVNGGIDRSAVPTIRCVHQSGDPGTGCITTWHTLAPDGTYSWSRPAFRNFNIDDRPAKWSRWGAFFYMAGTGIDPGPLYGDGHDYGDGSVYGGGITPAKATDIIGMLREWKAPHSWLNWVALVWPAGAVNPTLAPSQDADGRWSHPNGVNTWAGLVDPGTGLPTRPNGVEFILDNPAP